MSCAKWKAFIGRNRGRARKLLVKAKEGLFQVRSPSFGPGPGSTSLALIRKFQIDRLKVSFLQLSLGLPKWW